MTVTLNSMVYTTNNYLVLSATNAPGAPVFTQTATGATITFNSSNWNDAVTVNVAAALGRRQAVQPARNRHRGHGDEQPAEARLLYNQDTVQHKLTVNVIDSSVPQVLVSPSTPITVSPTQPSSYTMQLTVAPVANVTIQLLDDGQTLLSSADPRFKLSDPSFGNLPTVTFTSANWNIPITINVAYNPSYVSLAACRAPSLQCVYPAQPQLTSSIQGPVIVEGYEYRQLRNLDVLRPAVDMLPIPTFPDMALRDGGLSEPQIRKLHADQHALTCSTQVGSSDGRLGGNADDAQTTSARRR